MKLSVLLATMLFGAVGIASAAPVCIGGTMATYEGLAGGCTIGNLLFSNFFYTGGASGAGVSAVLNTAITLTPVNVGTFSPGPGIVFTSSGWNVPAGSSTSDVLIDSSILFDVSSVDGRQILVDGTLTLLSAASTGSGVAEIGETIEPGNVQLQVNANGPLVSHTIYPAQTTVSVDKDVLVLVPQGGPGSASIGSFAENFSEMPEPVGSVLIGSGLLALGIWRRRVSRRS
jgi:hypothetical protein